MGANALVDTAKNIVEAGALVMIASGAVAVVAAGVQFFVGLI